MAFRFWPRLFNFAFLIALGALPKTGLESKQAPLQVGEELPLLDQLLSDLGCGHGACKKVGSLARAALKPPTDALRTVASKVGGSHAERDLHRWVDTQVWRKLLPKT